MSHGQQHRSLGRVSATVGWTVSALLHAMALVSLGIFVKPYEFDFELAIPSEVEFGVAEAVAVATGPVGGTETGTETETETGTETGTETETETETGTETETETGTETETDSALVSESIIEGPSRMPEGAHIALRVDMARVRQSVVAQDVNRFLSAIPDWQLLLDGSGIDPVADLDRLLIATPDLQRANLVLAGRHRRDEAYVKDRVQALAQSATKSASWKTRLGIPTAPWHNRDVTARTIALLGPKHFSITRPVDLQRLLALAKVRESRDAEQEGLEQAKGADALLSMGPDEAVSLEVEGLQRFVIGSVRHVPIRLRTAIVETGPNEATVEAMGTYASGTEAEAAASFWKNVRDFYLDQPVVHFMGLSSTLTQMKLKPDEERLRMTTKLNAQQIRMLLAYIEGLLVGRGANEPIVPQRKPHAPRQESRLESRE